MMGETHVDDNGDDCGVPCPFDEQCEKCFEYWQTMVHLGLFVPGEGWTRQAELEWKKSQS